MPKRKWPRTQAERARDYRRRQAARLARAEETVRRARGDLALFLEVLVPYEGKQVLREIARDERKARERFGHDPVGIAETILGLNERHPDSSWQVKVGKAVRQILPLSEDD